MQPSRVVKAVCDLTGTTFDELCEWTPHPELIRAREKLCGALRSLTVLSYPDISSMMGRKGQENHSAPMEAVERFNADPLAAADFLAEVAEKIAREDGCIRRDSEFIEVVQEEPVSIPTVKTRKKEWWS